jgi:hypothetical protein
MQLKYFQVIDGDKDYLIAAHGYSIENGILGFLVTEDEKTSYIAVFSKWSNWIEIEVPGAELE